MWLVKARQIKENGIDNKENNLQHKGPFKIIFSMSSCLLHIHGEKKRTQKLFSEEETIGLAD